MYLKSLLAASMFSAIALSKPTPFLTTTLPKLALPDGSTIVSTNFSSVNGNTSITACAEPLECNIAGIDARASWDYQQFTLGNGNTACVGWKTSNDCGIGARADSEYSDMENSILQQITKDDFSTDTTVGRWLSYWNFPTTATPDQNGKHP